MQYGYGHARSARGKPNGGSADRNYEANTEQIPPLDTKVDVIFEVIRDKKD